MPAPTRFSSPRLGMTLVELLMVLVIVVILIAVIAPLTRIGTQDRKLREAARQINAYLAGAQARAAERGRPVFVQFVRAENSCVRMGLAEVPPPYTGDITDAVVTSITGTGPWTVNFASGHVSGLQSRKLVLGTAGESIRFNFQGHLYPIVSVSETTLLITSPITSVTGQPPVVGALGLPFQIYRAPIASAAAPLTLPVGTAIDLTASGGGTTGTQFSLAANDVTPVQIGFAPSGGVSGVLYSNTYLVGQAVHLLIGRIDRLGLENLKDPDAIWISVNPTTGICTTTDNRVDPTVASPTVDYARTYATASQNLGGR